MSIPNHVRPLGIFRPIVNKLADAHVQERCLRHQTRSITLAWASQQMAAPSSAAREITLPSLAPTTKPAWAVNGTAAAIHHRAGTGHCLLTMTISAKPHIPAGVDPVRWNFWTAAPVADDADDRCPKFAAAFGTPSPAHEVVRLTGTRFNQQVMVADRPGRRRGQSMVGSLRHTTGLRTVSAIA